MNATDLHVVFGAGQIGSFLAEGLLRDGHRVRVVKRSAAGVPEGAEPLLGDATDPAFCRAAAEGAAVLYHCMNPDYSTKVWADVLPRYQRNLVDAAGSAGARLVVLNNLYMMGTGGGRPINEETPVAPRSRKGEIRARLLADLLEAHRRGDARITTGLASDYYGPRGVGTHFAERFWRPALIGKPAEFIPNPDQPHTFHFTRDVADALKTLGVAGDDAYGRAWMLPCAPAEPSRALVARFSRALGREIRLRGIPKPIFKLLGLFMPIVGEVGEMLHQWEEPFVVDDSRFRAAFGATATDPDEGARQTVAWARSAFGS